MKDDEQRQARDRVAEFLRQWAMRKDVDDLIHNVHIDPQSDDGAELRASDLTLLINEAAS